tara:strand:- start:776 stop:1021 length:246 start_codon:yes stop_codon:yes gene_type:complete
MNRDMEENKVDLKSSVGDKYFPSKNKHITQIVHFVGGEKRTFSGVISETIRQGQFTKYKLTDGSMVLINDKNVLCIEVFSE